MITPEQHQKLYDEAKLVAKLARTANSKSSGAMKKKDLVAQIENKCRDIIEFIDTFEVMW